MTDARSQPSIASIIHELRVSGDPTEEAWADAIEAIKEQVAWWEEQSRQQIASIEELEAALRQIADTDQYQDHEDTAAELREIARAALQSEKTP